MDEPKRSKKALIIGIALLLVFAAAYAFVLCSFKNEAENRAVALSPNEKLGNDRVDASSWSTDEPGKNHGEQGQGDQHFTPKERKKITQGADKKAVVEVVFTR